MRQAHTATAEVSPSSQSGFQAALHHWPEFLMEGAGLGVFMISACVFTVLLSHPGSPLMEAIKTQIGRRALIGVAMGLTAIALITSPWGKRSGAHLNPAVTLTFYSLGKIAAWDAFFYVIFQIAGGATGVAIAAYVIGLPIRHPAINYVVTHPGRAGEAVAFIAEMLISAMLMYTVLSVSNRKRLARYTPVFAGTLVALFITFEAPLSGMSMNPARSLGSAINADDWTSLWLYLTAPPAGMALASLVYRSQRGIHKVFCAKLHHHNDERCIFKCRFGELHD